MKSIKSIIILFPFLLLSPQEISASNNKIETTVQATAYLQKVINDIPAQPAALASYQKAHHITILLCAKMLYDTAFTQILNALSEIDSRIAYWQYQKDHPWNYFISKNPLKWVTGPKQEEEVVNHLDVLKSHQGELYVLLGQFSELGTIFMQEHKTTFLTDQNKAYEWINKLLDALIRIKTNKEIKEDVPFIAQIKKLQLKLENVDHFKDDLLSDTTATEIPSYLTRNWLKGGLSIFTIGYGYKNYYDQIASALIYSQQQGLEHVARPVWNTLKDVLTPGWRTSSQKIISKLDESQEGKKGFAQEYLAEMGPKYGLQEDAENAIKELANNNFSLYEKFVETVGKKELEVSYTSPVQSTQDWLNTMKDYVRGLIIGGKAEAVQDIQDIVQYVQAEREQFAGVIKLALLIPAMGAAGGLRYAYQKLSEKNYSPLRRALVDINSLFVDPSKLLTDEQYGKMIYLVHMLKKRAERELSTKGNMREDFIHDLERIESSEFNVAAKRAIVEDMFKKYSFLGLVQKK